MKKLLFYLLTVDIYFSQLSFQKHDSKGILTNNACYVQMAHKCFFRVEMCEVGDKSFDLIFMPPRIL